MKSFEFRSVMEPQRIEVHPEDIKVGDIICVGSTEMFVIETGTGPDSEFEVILESSAGEHNIMISFDSEHTYDTIEVKRKAPQMILGSYLNAYEVYLVDDEPHIVAHASDYPSINKKFISMREGERANSKPVDPDEFYQKVNLYPCD